MPLPTPIKEEKSDHTMYFHIHGRSAAAGSGTNAIENQHAKSTMDLL